MLAYQIQKNHYYDRDWTNDQKYDSGDCRRLRLGNHHPRPGNRSLPYPDLCSAQVCSLQGSRTSQEQLSADSLPKVPRREEQTLGWRVLYRWLLYYDRRQGAEHRAGESLHREARHDDTVLANTPPAAKRRVGFFIFCVFSVDFDTKSTSSRLFPKRCEWGAPRSHFGRAERGELTRCLILKKVRICA